MSVNLARVLSVFLSLGFAAAVDAQVTIDCEGPTRVESDDLASLFEATVTTNYNFDLNLKVYLNGTIKHNRTTPVVNSGPTYDYEELVSHVGWGMAVGDTLLYRAKATLTSGPNQGAYATDNITITVSTPTGLKRYEIGSFPSLPALARRSNDWRVL